LDFTWLAASGVLVGIIIFALKVSLGCGLASLSRREVLLIAAGYLGISLFMGVAVELLPDDLLTTALDAGVALHLLVAMLLVALGVMTAKNWNSHRHDISRKTFWILSLPCPACLAASFISCSFLAGIVKIEPWKIGVVVGLIFFFSIAAFSGFLGRIKRAPSAMGHAMIFLGLFYLMSMLIIPAYLNSQKISFVPTDLQFMEVAYSYLTILSIVGLGFIARKRGIPI
jgi:predicted transporter